MAKSRKKQPAAHLRYRYALGALMAVLCLPAVIALLGTQSRFDWESHLAPPPFSVSALLKGGFQNDWERWWSDHFGGRLQLVQTYNTLSALIFQQTSENFASRVVVGKSRTLYEEKYVQIYNGSVRGIPLNVTTVPHAEVLDALELASRTLPKMGVGFALVFYPPKPAIYPEFLPRGWQVPEGIEKEKREYQGLMEELTRRKIPHIDGIAAFQELRERFPAVPLFARGGSHWSGFGSCHILNRWMSLVRSQLTRPLPEMNCVPTSTQISIGMDIDIGNMMHVWTPDKLFGEPVFVTAASALNPPRLSWIFEGTSFSEMIRDNVRASGYLGKETWMPYFERVPKDFDWDSALAEHPLIMVEQVGWSRLTANTVDFVLDLEKHSPAFRKAAGTPPIRALSGK